MLVKLKVEDADKPRLQATFSDYKEAWQCVSEWAFSNKTRNRSKVHSGTYKEVRLKYPNLNSGLVQQARNDAIAKLSSAKSNGHKLRVAPKLKKVSLRFDNRTSSLKGNILSMAVNGKGRIKTTLIGFPRLDEHRSYKTLAPLVFMRDGQYWVALTFDVPEQPGKSGPILGIDMGLRILAATSDGQLIRGTKMNRLRRTTRFLKSALQRKGTKSANRHLRRIRRKEQRQSRDVTHCAVNQILKSEAAIFAVEDLDLRARKYRKSSNRRRFSVPLSEFVGILEYKAALSGRRVVKVKPYFTSQDDCRGIASGIRTGGKYLGSDGKVLHADINAACNIALRAKSAFELNNPASVFYISGQGAVNHPNAGGSGLQASIPLG